MSNTNNNPFMPMSAGETAPFNGSSAPAPSAGGNAPMPGGSSAANDAFEVDLTNVEDNSVVAEGEYRARCIDVTQDVSKSGNPMFVWQFEITDGKYTGRVMRLWTAITPAAMWKVAETVIALGIGQNGQVVKFKRSDVLNRECGIVVEPDEYDGKASSRISRVIPLKDLA